MSIYIPDLNIEFQDDGLILLTQEDGNDDRVFIHAIHVRFLWEEISKRALGPLKPIESDLEAANDKS